MLPTTVRARVLSGAILVSLICLTILSSLPQPKALEAARSPVELDQLVTAWGPKYCARVGFSLGFDYLFMAAYVTAIGLGCAVVADKTYGFLQGFGIVLAYAQICSGCIDATENAALIRLLVAGYCETLMSIGRFATASKFVIPVAGMVYISAVLAVSRFRKD